MRLYDFGVQVKKGRVGEEIVALYLLKHGLVRTVLNRTEVEEYQRLGVDFVCEGVDGGPLLVEVKTDSYTSGNFFFETESRCESDVPGCFLSSGADVWFYYFSRWDRGYWLPLSETRRYVLALEHGWRRVGVATGRGRVSYTSSGLLVPISAVVRGVEGVGVHEGVRASVDEIPGSLN